MTDSPNPWQLNWVAFKRSSPQRLLQNIIVTHLLLRASLRKCKFVSATESLVTQVSLIILVWVHCTTTTTEETCAHGQYCRLPPGGSNAPWLRPCGDIAGQRPRVTPAGAEWASVRPWAPALHTGCTLMRRARDPLAPFPPACLPATSPLRHASQPALYCNSPARAAALAHSQCPGFFGVLEVNATRAD